MNPAPINKATWDASNQKAALAADENIRPLIDWLFAAMCAVWLFVFVSKVRDMTRKWR
jgi:hypothetical protein